MKTIQMIPVIHARTDWMDFRTGKLLFAPRFFNGNDELSKKVLDVANTSVGELIKRPFIRSIFSDGNICVLGITTTIVELSKRCGRDVKFSYVDTARHNRTAYAYIGVAFRVSDQPQFFDLQPETIADIYEKYIAMRWDEHGGEAGAYDTRYVDEPISLTPLSINTKSNDEYATSLSEALQGKPTLYIEGMIIQRQNATNNENTYHNESDVSYSNRGQSKKGNNKRVIDELKAATKGFESGPYKDNTQNISLVLKCVLVGTIVIAGVIFLYTRYNIIHACHM